MTNARGYGQFCPVAIASEVLAERWTLLVMRELLCGSTRFNDLHRGVPLMSASLLSRRLKELEEVGLVERRPLGNSKGHGYFPTEAGLALRPLIDGIGLWGLKYMRTTYDKRNLDPNLLMWDMRRWIRPEHLPPGRIVMRLDLTDAKRLERHFWLVKDESEADLDLCLYDPGFDVDLVITSDIESLTRMWLGDIEVERAVQTGAVRLDGPPALRMSFYDWIGLSPFAHAREERKPQPAVAAG
jgi:DNA-binding HxlR family transcriptional regulator